MLPVGGSDIVDAKGQKWAVRSSNHWNATSMQPSTLRKIVVVRLRGKVTVIISHCAISGFGGNTDGRAGRIREKFRESARSSARQGTSTRESFRYPEFHGVAKIQSTIGDTRL